MVVVGFCSYWRLAVAAAAGSAAAAVAVSGYFFTTLGLLSLYCYAVCWDSVNCHCFATSDLRKGRFAACGPKWGLFFIPRFGPYFEPYFFPLLEPILQHTNSEKGLLRVFVCGR